MCPQTKHGVTERQHQQRVPEEGTYRRQDQQHRWRRGTATEFDGGQWAVDGEGYADAVVEGFSVERGEVNKKER